MLSVPDRYNEHLPSLYQVLNKKIGKIYAVHRLDKETSGLILFAKDQATHKYLSLLFENRQVEKNYLGLITGALQPKTGLIEAPVADHPYHRGVMIVSEKGKPSATAYEVA